MVLKDLNDVEKVLASYVPTKEDASKPYSLDRMSKLMDFLGNPQNELEIIHVAGTSGKTSTSYYIAGLLNSIGQKVGLTVSPHITAVNERVQINLKPLNEKLYCREFTTFLAEIEKFSIKPTYFELLIAFAFWEFHRQKVDFAVIEVGLGGLLDGTNVIVNPYKLCVITDIGFDHVNKLGHSLEEIATQKAGIIHQDNEVFFLKQEPIVSRVINEVAIKRNAKVHEITLDVRDEITKLPLFQQRNFSLALAVCDALIDREHLPKITSKKITKVTDIKIPGRMETIIYKGRTIIIDGAHNAQKLTAFTKSLQHKYPKIKCSILMSLASNQPGVVEAISPIANHVIITSFVGNQDEPRQSLGVEYLEKSLKEKDIDCEIEPKIEKALNKLMKRPEELLIVTGSFYLLNSIRPIILEE